MNIMKKQKMLDEKYEKQKLSSEQYEKLKSNYRELLGKDDAQLKVMNSNERALPQNPIYKVLMETSQKDNPLIRELEERSIKTREEYDEAYIKTVFPNLYEKILSEDQQYPLVESQLKELAVASGHKVSYLFDVMQERSLTVKEIGEIIDLTKAYKTDIKSVCLLLGKKYSLVEVGEIFDTRKTIKEEANETMAIVDLTAFHETFGSGATFEKDCVLEQLIKLKEAFKEAFEEKADNIWLGSMIKDAVEMAKNHGVSHLEAVCEMIENSKEDRFPHMTAAIGGYHFGDRD